MKIRPLHNKVLIKPAKKDNETNSGLQLIKEWDPDVTGTVTAVGYGLLCPKCGTRQHMAVDVGDEVVFPYTDGETVTINDESYITIECDDILAVVED